MGQVLQPFNQVDMRGRVGSHEISLKDDGHWEGWFDLHVPTRDHKGVWTPQCFTCHVAEDGRHVKDLGAGISGKIVNIRGRLLKGFNHCYINVTHLTVVGGAGDELKVPDPPKTEADRRLEKGVLF
jgi:hypothetical protein